MPVLILSQIIILSILIVQIVLNGVLLSLFFNCKVKTINY